MKKQQVTLQFIDNVDALLTKRGIMREEQKVFVTFKQEQVDKIFQTAVLAANKKRFNLTKMDIKKYGMGTEEDNVIKNMLLRRVELKKARKHAA